MEVKEILNACKAKMQNAVEAYKKELSQLRTGRPTPDIVSHVKVDAYGAKTPINELANITVADAKTLLVNVWDKNLVNKVDTAIRESGLGFNPVVDGTTLKIYLPPLTEERRKELSKISGKYAEEFKIQIRNTRRDSLEQFKHLKKEASISEDDLHSHNKEVEEYTSSFIKDIDSLLKVKEKELEQI